MSNKTFCIIIILILIVWIPFAIICIRESLTYKPIEQTEEEQKHQELIFKQARCQSGSYPEDCEELEELQKEVEGELKNETNLIYKNRY